RLLYRCRVDFVSDANPMAGARSGGKGAATVISSAVPQPLCHLSIRGGGIASESSKGDYVSASSLRTETALRSLTDEAADRTLALRSSRGVFKFSRFLNGDCKHSFLAQELLYNQIHTCCMLDSKEVSQI